MSPGREIRLVENEEAFPRKLDIDPDEVGETKALPEFMQ